MNTKTQQSKNSPTSQLAPHLEMGAVTLNVKDLNISKAFYTDLVDLKEVSATQNSSVLGWNYRAVVTLNHTPELKTPPYGSAGLYHLAIVFESRSTLAQSVQKILSTAPELYVGTADHLVSEAFYFTDPEGNGVELYFDKDPKTWQWQNGQVVMDSIYINPLEYINAHINQKSSLIKKMGHVHLKVGSITEAKQFYHQVLGLALTAVMPTALFMSNGTYHHHVGMNVWESLDAGVREPSLGLNQFEIYLPTELALTELKQRLESNHISHTMTQNQIKLDDPWGSTLLFSVNPTYF